MKKILILSGPTHEYIDPVRFIANASSGIMGKEIAELCMKSFDLTFITGPIHNQNLPSQTNNVKILNITSSNQMNAKALEIFPNVDICIFAAAISDYKPKIVSKNKISSKQTSISIELESTNDIAKNIGKIKKINQICIGFSLQDNDDIEIAYQKLINKNLDLIIINQPSSIGADQGRYVFLNKNKEIITKTDVISKKECSIYIVDFINKLIKNRKE